LRQRASCGYRSLLPLKLSLMCQLLCQLCLVLCHFMFAVNSLVGGFPPVSGRIINNGWVVCLVRLVRVVSIMRQSDEDAEWIITIHHIIFALHDGRFESELHTKANEGLQRSTFPIASNSSVCSLAATQSSMLKCTFLRNGFMRIPKCDEESSGFRDWWVGSLLLLQLHQFVFEASMMPSISWTCLSEIPSRSHQMKRAAARWSCGFSYLGFKLGGWRPLLFCFNRGGRTEKLWFTIHSRVQ
jgi:hypothetical protein